MPKFRKRPIVIETAQFRPDLGQWPKGVRNRPDGLRCECSLSPTDTRPHVHTVHNNQRVDVASGDWIVLEPDGEHYYPIKDDVFCNLYEAVECSPTS